MDICRHLTLALLVACSVGYRVAATDAANPTPLPTCVQVSLTPSQITAAKQGRLGWQAATYSEAAPAPVPVQWRVAPGARVASATFIIPAGTSRPGRDRWETVKTPFLECMRAFENPSDHQVDLSEAGRPVLRYNWQRIEPGAVLQQVSEANRMYARPRSDYIHPLYGLGGEILTQDWPIDHPHHRGIYWAWPEVEYGRERGDLHALQRVFARPSGGLKLRSGAVYAQIEADNLWLWEDREPIVRERVLIRAYQATIQGRIIDLLFQFQGLKEGVTIARRDTTHYGGLNLRLATPRSQVIATHTDPPGALPRRAWSDLSGLFVGNAPAGLTVLQHAKNPGYPGEWVQYPELSWCQPTFPDSGTRYPLPPGQALVLRFRLWDHAEGSSDQSQSAGLWDAWHAPQSAVLGLDD